MFAESHDRRRYRWRRPPQRGGRAEVAQLGGIALGVDGEHATVTDIGSEHEAVTSFELEHDHRLAVDRTDVERRGREPLGQVEQEARHPLGPDHRPPGGPTFGAAVAEQHHIGVEQREQGVDVAVVVAASNRSSRSGPAADTSGGRANAPCGAAVGDLAAVVLRLADRRGDHPERLTEDVGEQEHGAPMPDNASSTTRKPSVSDSATSAAAAGSPSASATGSGSHGPT